MIKKVRQYVKENNMIRRGDRICVGLSGGADSVCLFLCLLEMKEELGFSLEAFHLNHNLRGEDSLTDEAFVKKLCEEHHVKLRLYSRDVAAEAEKLHMGLEQTGHVLRKEIAAQCLKEGCTKIALAHHRNDLAETFLFNVSRGCSIGGLTGIRPVAGPVIRPLLPFSRAQIEEELNRRGASWRTDLSNSDETYTRNYLRHTVIPALENRVNEKTVDHIYELSQDLAQAEELISEKADACAKRYVLFEQGRCTIQYDLKKEKPLVSSMVIKKCIEHLSGRKHDISRKNIEDVSALFEGQKGRKIDLPFQLTAVSDYAGVLLCKTGETEEKVLEMPFVPEESIQCGGAFLTSEILPYSEELKEEKKQYTKCFDYDIIKRNCVLRTRKPGDRILISPDGKSKKLKEFFTDRKISSQKRDRILLLAEGNIIHWVIGYRMGDSAKITGKTKKILKIQVSGDYTDEHSDQ